MENETKHNLKEASESLGISLNTLKKRMDHLQIATVVDGKKKLISSADLQRLKEISRKQKTIKLTDSTDGFDDELTGEIKNLRERLDKIESRLIDNQINSQLIDNLTSRILEQSNVIESLILKNKSIVSSVDKHKPKTTSENPQKGRQQVLPKKPVVSQENKKPVARESKHYKQPLQENAIREAVAKLFPDGLPKRLEKEPRNSLLEELRLAGYAEITGKYLSDVLARIRNESKVS